jgi:hypothetical protein
MPQNRARPIRVALQVADPVLRARIVRACEGRDVVLAGADEAIDDAVNTGEGATTILVSREIPP